jgi:hypothetical protein
MTAPTGSDLVEPEWSFSPATADSAHAPKPLAVLLIVHSLPPFEYTGTPLIAFGYARGLVSRGARVGVV